MDFLIYFAQILNDAARFAIASLGISAHAKSWYKLCHDATRNFASIYNADKWFIVIDNR